MPKVSSFHIQAQIEHTFDSKWELQELNGSLGKVQNKREEQQPPACDL